MRALFAFALLLITLFVLHVGLYGSPECTDVSLAEARGASALDELQVEGVVSEKGLGEHLEQVPVKWGKSVFISTTMQQKIFLKSICIKQTFKHCCFICHHPSLTGLKGKKSSPKYAENILTLRPSKMSLFLHQIWRNVALHHLLTNESSAVNGCRQRKRYYGEILKHLTWKTLNVA